MKLSVAPEVAKALAANEPVVALESTVIAHGLPRPRNLSTAKALEAEIDEFLQRPRYQRGGEFRGYLALAGQPDFTWVR
jgi:hypothetical protein